MKRYKDFIKNREEDDYDRRDGKRKKVSWKDERRNKNKDKYRSYEERDED